MCSKYDNSTRHNYVFWYGLSYLFENFGKSYEILYIYPFRQKLICCNINCVRKFKVSELYGHNNF